MRGALANDLPTCLQSSRNRAQGNANIRTNKQTDKAQLLFMSQVLDSIFCISLASNSPAHLLHLGSSVVCLTTVSSWASCLPSDDSPQTWLIHSALIMRIKHPMHSSLHPHYLPCLLTCTLHAHSPPHFLDF